MRDIRSLEVPKPPPLDEQKAIAHILGTLDDKIELNRRMNQTLEAMARAIFKSWFVDFDPVRARAEGRTPPGLDPATAALFPNSFEDSPRGPIPKGWEMGTLGELCDKPQYGYTASASAEAIGPKFLRITDINKHPWVNWETVPYCDIGDDEYTRYRLHAGDILIARMADPGHGVLIEESVDGVFASYLIRFRPTKPEHARYLQYWLRSSAYWGLVAGRQAGTTRASLNAQVLSRFPLVAPPERTVEAFSERVVALRNAIVGNIRQSNTLAAIRDALLPKLLSGEVRVCRRTKPSEMST